jgi:hypothetical protein
MPAYDHVPPRITFCGATLARVPEGRPATQEHRCGDQ